MLIIDKGPILLILSVLIVGSSAQDGLSISQLDFLLDDEDQNLFRLGQSQQDEFTRRVGQNRLKNTPHHTAVTYDRQTNTAYVHHNQIGQSTGLVNAYSVHARNENMNPTNKEKQNWATGVLDTQFYQNPNRNFVGRSTGRDIHGPVMGNDGRPRNSKV